MFAPMASGTPSLMMSIECLAVERQHHRPPQFDVVERRLVQVDQHRARHVADIDLANRLRRLLLEILQRRDRHAQRDGVELAGEEGEVARRRLRA